MLTQGASAQTTIFFQDFNGTAVTDISAASTLSAEITETEYYTTTGEANQLTKIEVGDNTGTTIDINSTVADNLFITDGSSGAYYLVNRNSDMAATAPAAAKITFNAKFDVTSTGTACRSILQIGDNFSNTWSYTAGAMKEADGNVFAGIAFRAENSASGMYVFKNDETTEYNSGVYVDENYQTWTIVINKTGSSLNYTDPTTGTSSVANNTFDLWVGTTQFGDDVAAVTSSVDINHFKLASLDESGVGKIDIYLDWFKVEDIGTCTTPTTQVGAISFANVQDTQMDVDLASYGSGDSILILAHSGAAVDADPVDNTNTYTANAAFGSGTEIGTGNYVVFKGVSGDLPVTVTGLTASTTYHYAAYAFSGCSGDSTFYKADDEATNSQTAADPPTYWTETYVWKLSQPACDGTSDQGTLSSPYTDTDNITLTGSGVENSNNSSTNINAQDEYMKFTSNYNMTEWCFRGKIQATEIDYSYDSITWTTITSLNTSGDENYSRSDMPYNTKTLYIKYTQADTEGLWLRNMSFVLDSVVLYTQWEGDVSSDWNTAGNWTDGVPTATVDAIIPDVNVPGVAYPTTSGSEVCKDIIFEAGAGVLGLENLTYDRAFVRMDVTRDHWYTLTAPLKDMFSGDFYFDGTPETFIKLFDTTDPDGSGTNYEGDFTRAFSSLGVALNSGEGLAFKMTQRTWDFPNGFTNQAADTTITFPRINTDSSLVESYVPYDALSGRKFTVLATTVTKDSTNKAYRFAAENASNQLVNDTVAVPTGFTLVGNPIMTHMNISNFLTTNATTNGVISDYVKVWTGAAYETYDGATDTWDGSFTGDYLAPMQSFVVNSDAGGNVVFDLSSHFGADDNSSALRSTRQKENMLFIKASKDGKTTGTVLTRQGYASNAYDANDIAKLFTPLDDVADVYTVADGKALSYNKFYSNNFTSSLGVKLGAEGMVNLQFEGADSFDDSEVYLVNVVEGTAQNLKENPNYEFDYNGVNPEGTLFVAFRSTDVVTDVSNAVNTDNIKVYDNGVGSIVVESSTDDMISEVVLFSLSGKVVSHHCCALRVSKLEIPADRERIYLVQVFTEQNSKMTKIRLK